jgi:heme-degrading monooxygenase HmoA
VSHVVINAINVPAEQHDAMAERFAARAGLVEKAEGFERFSLLRPADGRDVWLVVTQWRDEEAFQAWMSSRAFGQQHDGRQAQGSPATGNEIWSFSVAQQVG